MFIEEVKNFHVDPSRNVKKSSSKIKFRGWPHFSVCGFNFVVFIKNRENHEILSTQNLIHVRYNANVYTALRSVKLSMTSLTVLAMCAHNVFNVVH